MKFRIVALLAVLALVMSVPAFANSINLLGPGSSSYSSGSYVYNFPVGSYYSQYYGIGTGIVGSSTYNSSIGLYTRMDASTGLTIGSITKFSYAYLEAYGDGFNFYGVLNNPAFNSKTDTFTGTFLVGGTTYHFTETFALGSSTDYGSFSGQYGYVFKGSISAVPEPGTLALLGAGIVGMAGVIRKKVSILRRGNG